MAKRSDPWVFDADRDPDARLVGVAIEIPEPFQTQLHTIRAAVGDPAARITRPHITLVPPTELSGDAFAGLRFHLSEAALAHQGFDVELRGMDSFRPVSPVVFARVVCGADRCASLERTVRAGPLGVPVDFDYHPHVTVAQRLPDEVLDRAEREHADLHVRFPVRSFECSAWSGDAWVQQWTFELAARA